MPLILNLRLLKDQELKLQGSIPVAELDLDIRDEAVREVFPLEYDLTVQEMDDALLIQGRLRLPLACECVRCLKRFDPGVDLPDWACHLPLTGDDAVLVTNDCVDLTPFLREDILLEFPQHPLCEPECRGLPKQTTGETPKRRPAPEADSKPSPWGALDKLGL